MRILAAGGPEVLGAAALAALGSWGHEIEVVRDGLDALRRARAHPPGLVVAGPGLARLEPLGLLAALRAGGGAAARAAFVLVGPPGRQAAEEARRLGAMGCLPSPVSVADLLRLVDRAAAGAPAGAARGP